LLTKHTYFIPIVLASLAAPTAALAAGHGGEHEARTALADAIVAPPHAPNLLERPVDSFHRLIRVQVHRIRAQQRAEERAERRRRRREEREAFAELPGGVSIETLEAIAACESGGDPSAVSSDGTYRGKYQFDYGTWESVGGTGDPAAAPEAEQDYRAALLYAQSGSSPWPICGA
jgi:hypothetical protein